MLKDGLYQVSTPYLCAGYIIKGGKVVACAPILKSKIGFWVTVGKFVSNN